MRSWWHRLRNDPALPAWLRIACLLAALLTLYAWPVQLIFLPIVGATDNTCLVEKTFGSRSLFLDLSKRAIIVNPVALEYAIVAAAILAPWAAMGFFITAWARSNRRLVYLRSIVACTLSLLAIPSLSWLYYYFSIFITLSYFTIPDSLDWNCEVAGPGYFEDLCFLLPLLYPALLAYLLYRSYRLAQARRAQTVVREP